MEYVAASTPHKRTTINPLVSLTRDTFIQEADLANSADVAPVHWENPGLPLFHVQRAHITDLQPRRDAVEMIRVIASSPRQNTLLVFDLVSLTEDALFHDVVPADATVFPFNVPRPQRHS